MGSFCLWFSVYLSETWSQSRLLIFSGRLKIKTLLQTQCLCHPSLLTMRRWKSADAIIQPTLLILLTFTQTHALDFRAGLSRESGSHAFWHVYACAFGSMIYIFLHRQGYQRMSELHINVWKSRDMYMESFQHM